MTTISIKHNGTTLLVSGTYRRGYDATLEQPGEDESFEIDFVTDSGVDVTHLHDLDEIAGLALEAHLDNEAYEASEAADRQRDERRFFCGGNGMKPAFTRGPWQAKPFVSEGRLVVVDVRSPASEAYPFGQIVASCNYVAEADNCHVLGAEQALANAQAVAAGPDLLTVAVEVDRLLTKQKWSIDGPDPESQLLAAARAAIARATGEQQ